MFLRLKFEKTGPIRFVGHLDLMRTFQKLILRTGLPIAYTEGFNPHQIFSFATALAVGVSSEAEYMDARFTQDVEVDQVISRMNECAPYGIKITDGVILDPKEPKAMALLSAAKYVVTQPEEIITQEMIGSMLTAEEIIIKKKTKKGKLHDVDLRPGMYHMAIVDGKIMMTIATGSSFNIKPEQVINAMLSRWELSVPVGYFKYHRQELYLEKDGLKPLIETKLG